MLSSIISNYNFIITNFTFNDIHKGAEGTYNFSIKLELSNVTSFSSINLDKLRFDVDIAMISMVNNEHIGFTLNASIQLIINLIKNIDKDKIRDLITNKTEENIKKIDEIIRPIIAKEIESIFNKTFYKGTKLDSLYE